MGRFLASDSGFSLVETMVATFIFALVSASGVVLLSGYQEGRLALAAADDRLARVEHARALIRDDMLSAVPRTMRDPYGGTLPGFEGGAHLPDGILLRFVRNGHMGALLAGNRSALQRVDYVLLEDQLVRRTYAHTDVTPETPVRDRVLLTNVRSVDVRYESQMIWALEWISSGSGEVDLPNLAEMTLRFSDGRQLQFTMLVGGSG